MRDLLREVWAFIECMLWFVAGFGFGFVACAKYYGVAWM